MYGHGGREYAGEVGIVTAGILRGK
jgi:hypothetical protein